MRKALFLIVVLGVFLVAGKAFAPLVTVVNDSSSSSSSSHSDTSVVDLSDKDTSKPVKLLR